MRFFFIQKLKAITNCGNVSLVGVSWGGAVCILMAQLLEAENIAVSLVLLEGIPNVLQEWTRGLVQYGNINAKLVMNYFQIKSVVNTNCELFLEKPVKKKTTPIF